MGIEINYGGCILEMCKSDPTPIRSDRTRLDFEAIRDVPDTVLPDTG